MIQGALSLCYIGPAQPTGYRPANSCQDKSGCLTVLASNLPRIPKIPSACTVVYAPFACHTVMPPAGIPPTTAPSRDVQRSPTLRHGPQPLAHVTRSAGRPFLVFSHLPLLLASPRVSSTNPPARGSGCPTRRLRSVTAWIRHVPDPGSGPRSSPPAQTYREYL